MALWLKTRTNILQDVDEHNGQRSMIEGYSYYGTGKQGDSNGAIVNARLAMDAGLYQRIDELSAGALPEELPTLMAIQKQHESQRTIADQITQRIKSNQPSQP